MIFGSINNQRLTLRGGHVVADTIDYLTARFNFNADWDGLSKWAHFANGDTVYDIPLTDDCIRKEDHLNLSAGEWKVYLHGNEFRDGDVVERITTNAETLQVLPTGTLDGEPFPEMPASVTEQILARLENIEHNGGSGGGGVAVTDMYIREGLGGSVGEAFKKTYTLVLKMSNGNEISCTLPEMGTTVADIITVSETDPTGESFEGHFWFNKASGSLWVYALAIPSGGIILPGIYTWHKVGGGTVSAKIADRAFVIG